MYIIGRPGLSLYKHLLLQMQLDTPFHSRADYELHQVMLSLCILWIHTQQWKQNAEHNSWSTVFWYNPLPIKTH